MVMKVRYVDKTTKEIAPTFEEWIVSLTDPVDKNAVQTIYNSEAERQTGVPANEFLSLFDRYISECNIEIIRTDE